MKPKTYNLDKGGHLHCEAIYAWQLPLNHQLHLAQEMKNLERCYIAHIQLAKVEMNETLVSDQKNQRSQKGREEKLRGWD